MPGNLLGGYGTDLSWSKTTATSGPGILQHLCVPTRGWPDPRAEMPCWGHLDAVFPRSRCSPQGWPHSLVHSTEERERERLRKMT